MFSSKQNLTPNNNSTINNNIKDFEPFFDRIRATHTVDDWQLRKPTEEQLKTCRQMYECPDASSLIELSVQIASVVSPSNNNDQVSSPALAEPAITSPARKILNASAFSKTNPNKRAEKSVFSSSIPINKEEANIYEWKDKSVPRVFNCMLCRNLLFLFDVVATSQQPIFNRSVEEGVADGDNIQSPDNMLSPPEENRKGRDGGRLAQNERYSPLYCISVEFAQLTILREREPSNEDNISPQRNATPVEKSSFTKSKILNEVRFDTPQASITHNKNNRREGSIINTPLSLNQGNNLQVINHGGNGAAGTLTGQADSKLGKKIGFQLRVRNVTLTLRIVTSTIGNNCLVNNINTLERGYIANLAPQDSDKGDDNSSQNLNGSKFGRSYLQFIDQFAKAGGVYNEEKSQEGHPAAVTNIQSHLRPNTLFASGMRNNSQANRSDIKPPQKIRNKSFATKPQLVFTSRFAKVDNQSNSDDYPIEATLEDKAGGAGCFDGDYSDNANIDVEEIERDLFKSWLRALNQWVVRRKKFEKFAIIEEIGHGGQATVYSIERKRGIKVEQSRQIDCNGLLHQNTCLTKNSQMALKVMDKRKLLQNGKNQQIQLLNEIRAQRELRLCGGTTKLIKIYECEKYLSLLMELHTGGNLGEVLEGTDRIYENQAKIIAAQLLLTVDFFQRKQMIHRDLKPENILLESQVQNVFDLRIADFGFAISLEEAKQRFKERPELICGTPGYIAPEALNHQGFSSKADIFSAGCIIFSVLTIRNLFSGQDAKEVILRNRDCQLQDIRQRLIQKKRSEECADFLEWILQMEVPLRPTAEQALRHGWFYSIKEGIECALSLNKILAAADSGELDGLNIDSALIEYAFHHNLSNHINQHNHQQSNPNSLSPFRPDKHGFGYSPAALSGISANSKDGGKKQQIFFPSSLGGAVNQSSAPSNRPHNSKFGQIQQPPQVHNDNSKKNVHPQQKCKTPINASAAARHSFQQNNEFEFGNIASQFRHQYHIEWKGSIGLRQNRFAQESQQLQPGRNFSKDESRGGIRNSLLLNNLLQMSSVAPTGGRDMSQNALTAIGQSFLQQHQVFKEYEGEVVFDLISKFSYYQILQNYKRPLNPNYCPKKLLQYLNEQLKIAKNREPIKFVEFNYREHINELTRKQQQLPQQQQQLLDEQQENQTSFKNSILVQACSKSGAPVVPHTLTQQELKGIGTTTQPLDTIQYRRSICLTNIEARQREFFKKVAAGQKVSTRNALGKLKPAAQGTKELLPIDMTSNQFDSLKEIKGDSQGMILTQNKKEQIRAALAGAHNSDLHLQTQVMQSQHSHQQQSGENVFAGSGIHNKRVPKASQFKRMKEQAGVSNRNEGRASSKNTSKRHQTDEEDAHARVAEILDQSFHELEIEQKKKNESEERKHLVPIKQQNFMIKEVTFSENNAKRNAHAAVIQAPFHLQQKEFADGSENRDERAIQQIQQLGEAEEINGKSQQLQVERSVSPPPPLMIHIQHYDTRLSEPPDEIISQKIRFKQHLGISKHPQANALSESSCHSESLKHSSMAELNKAQVRRVFLD